MISTLRSATCLGIDAHLITVEVDVGLVLPGVTIVGLPGQAVKESRDRVRAAIRNSDCKFPPGRITVNLAPANLKKEGPSFDLPIALGVLAACGCVNPANLKSFIITGERALDESVRPVKGALPAALLAKTTNKRLIVPLATVEEGSFYQQTQQFGVR